MFYGSTTFMSYWTSDPAYKHTHTHTHTHIYIYIYIYIYMFDWLFGFMAPQPLWVIERQILLINTHTHTHTRTHTHTHTHIYMCVCVCVCVCVCLVGYLGLWHINLCRLLKAKSVFMKIVLFQTIQLSISTQFKTKYSLIVKNISIWSYSV